MIVDQELWEKAYERLSAKVGKPTGATECMDILISLILGLDERLAVIERELRPNRESQRLPYEIPAD